MPAKWRSGWPKSGGQAGRKVAVRLAEKWRSGWPKSGGQAGRKVAVRRSGWPKSGGQAVRLAEKWRSGGQAGRKVAVRRSGWPKSGGQAVMSLISHRQKEGEDVKEHIKLFIESKKFNVKNTVRDTNIILNMMHERRKIYIQLSSHQLNYYPELKL